jgi:hypothetical protein
MREAARLLADAKENENSLTKLLDQNNVKYKDRNGNIIKLNELLIKAGDLINRFGSMPEKVEAAKMLGLTEAWVNALRGGGQAFNDLANGAQAAGAVIDGATVAKAAAFDEAWKKSSALLSTQFKAVAADIASSLDDLIDKAGKFFEALAESRGQAPGSGQEKFNRYADALDVARKESAGLAQDVAQLDRVIANMSASGGDPDIIRGLEAARVKAVELQKELAKTELAGALSAFPGGAGTVPLPGARPAGADRPNPNAASLPSRKKETEEATTALERQTEQIEKHIKVTEASTAAVGLNVGEQERLKTQALLVAAAERDGVTVTGEYAAALEELARRAGAARLEHDKAAEQMARVQQAYQIVGSSISTAFADAIIEGKKLNEVMSSLLKTLARAAINSTISGLFKAITPGSISGFASGTSSAPGGLAMVGERGPELVNLPRGSQVIPNDVLRRGAGGTGAITYAPAIDARGASVEAVARLAQIIEQDRAMFASRTVATIQQARRGRVPGV